MPPAVVEAACRHSSLGFRSWGPGLARLAGQAGLLTRLPVPGTSAGQRFWEGDRWEEKCAPGSPPDWPSCPGGQRKLQAGLRLWSFRGWWLPPGRPPSAPAVIGFLFTCARSSWDWLHPVCPSSPTSSRFAVKRGKRSPCGRPCNPFGLRKSLPGHCLTAAGLDISRLSTPLLPNRKSELSVFHCQQEGFPTQSTSDLFLAPAFTKCCFLPP